MVTATKAPVTQTKTEPSSRWMLSKAKPINPKTVRTYLLERDICVHEAIQAAIKYASHINEIEDNPFQRDMVIYGDQIYGFARGYQSALCDASDGKVKIK